MSSRRVDYIRNKIKQTLIKEIEGASDTDLFFRVNSLTWSTIGNTCMKLWAKHIKGEL